MLYLNKLKQVVEDLCSIPSESIRSCTEAEVTHLEQEMGLMFPAAYREFLLWCGKKLGRVVWDDRFYYPFQPEMKEEAIDALTFHQQNASFIQENVIVILSHEGYLYDFIRADEGDDPPVYRLIVGQEVELASPHFSDYLYNTAILYLKRHHNFR